MPDSRAGKIILRTFQDGDWVVAEVEDDGIGIADGVRDKIFEPFFSTKESSIDMGLGLAITYGIVKDYGGEIELISQEGMGACSDSSFRQPGSWKVETIKRMHDGKNSGD